MKPFKGVFRQIRVYEFCKPHMKTTLLFNDDNVTRISVNNV